MTVMTLQFLARQACLHILLTDNHHDEVLRSLETNCYTAVSQSILDRMVKLTPDSITNRILNALLPDHIRKVELPNCENVSLMGLIDVLKRCYHIETVDLSHCPQLMTEGVFEVMGLLQLPITYLSLENTEILEDHMVHMVITNLPHLTSLNLAENRKLTDEIFLVDPLEQLSREIQSMEEPMYKYKLSSVNVSCCRGISGLAILHLTSLVGPHLKQFDMSWTMVDCSALLYLAGYNCEGAATLLSESLVENRSTEEKKNWIKLLTVLKETWSSLTMRYNSLTAITSDLDITDEETDKKKIKENDFTFAEDAGEIVKDTAVAVEPCVKVISKDDHVVTIDTNSPLRDQTNVNPNHHVKRTIDGCSLAIVNMECVKDEDFVNVPSVINYMEHDKDGVDTTSETNSCKTHKASVINEIDCDIECVDITLETNSCKSHTAPVINNNDYDIECVDKTGETNSCKSHTAPVINNNDYDIECVDKTGETNSCKSHTAPVINNNDYDIECVDKTGETNSCKYHTASVINDKECADKTGETNSCKSHTAPMINNNDYDIECVDNVGEIDSCKPYKADSLEPVLCNRISCCCINGACDDNVSTNLCEESTSLCVPSTSLNEQTTCSLCENSANMCEQSFSMCEQSTSLCELSSNMCEQSSSLYQQSSNLCELPFASCCSHINTHPHINTITDSSKNCNILYQNINHIFDDMEINATTPHKNSGTETSGCYMDTHNQSKISLSDIDVTVTESVVKSETSVQIKEYSDEVLMPDCSNDKSSIVNTVKDNETINNTVNSDIIDSANPDTDLQIRKCKTMMENVNLGMSDTDDPAVKFDSNMNMTNIQTLLHKKQESATDKPNFEAENNDKGSTKQIHNGNNEAAQNQVIGPVFSPRLQSLNITAIKFIDKHIGALCLKQFFLNNSTLKRFSISWSQLDGELIKFSDNYRRFANCKDPYQTAPNRSWLCLVPSLQSLQVAEFVECSSLQAEGVLALGTSCRNLTHVNLTEVHFFKDSAIRPLLCQTRLRSLSLAGSEVSDKTLHLLAEKQSSTLTDFNLSWCEDYVTEQGINTICRKCTNLQVLDLRKCPVSDMSLQLLGENCKNITNLCIQSAGILNEKGFTNVGLFSIAQNLTQLRQLDISWNMLGLTDSMDKTVTEILARCLHLEEAVMNGFKTVTVAPFLPIIADYGKMQHPPSEESGVMTRSCVYAPNLRVLELAYCDMVDEYQLLTIVQACKGTLAITDYYGLDVEKEYGQKPD